MYKNTRSPFQDSAAALSFQNTCKLKLLISLSYYVHKSFLLCERGIARPFILTEYYCINASEKHLL